MSKIFTWIIAVVAAAAISAPTYAGFNLGNGLSTNGLSTNGVNLAYGLSTNGIRLGNGLTSKGILLNDDPTALQAVRLVLPDGTDLALR